MSIAGGLPISDMSTVIATLVHKTPIGKFEHITETRYWPIQKYLIEKRKKHAHGGTKIVHDIVLQPKGVNRGSYTNPLADDVISVNENMLQIEVPWAILNHNMMYDERELQSALQRGGKGKAAAISIQDFYRSRRDQNIIIPWADDLEDSPWLMPIDANDKKAVLGLPYWVNMANAGATTEGWVGQTARYSGGGTSTVIGGIDKSTNALWRNRVQFWSGRVDHQIIAQMRTMCHFLRMSRPPGGDTNVRDSTRARHTICCGEDVFLELQNLADSRTASGKGDLTNVDGEVKFNGMPILPVPRLDSTVYTADGLAQYKPIYFLNLDTWYFWIANGEWMKRVGPREFPINGKARTWGEQYYTQFQYMCINPRMNGVMHTLIPA